MEVEGRVAEDWPCWRLVLEGVARLEELESWYSLDDAADANEALDAWREAQARANDPKR